MPSPAIDVAPLVTVVTPSFNQGRFIRETIDSVLGQGYPRIEYLVVDGGSTDDTLGVLRAYGDRLTWLSEPDRGQADAINKGWQRGQGSILAYLNSDDTYLAGAVERAVAWLVAHPGSGAVYGEAYYTDEQGHVLGRYPTEPFRLDRLAETCFICQPTVFLRRSIVEQVGYLDASLRYTMDYDLWMRVGRVAPFDRVSEYLATSRLHAGSKSLGERAGFHAEILATVHRHFGAVTTRWALAYADDRLRPGRRPGSLGSVAFTARLVALTLATYVRYNRRPPPLGWRRWLGWSRVVWRKLLDRPL